MTTTLNREAWLLKATTALRKALFAPKGLTVPEVKVSTGWPSRGGLSASKQVIGEHWTHKVADDGIAQLFISPVLVDSVAVLDTLGHEMLHALTPGDKHGGQFKRLIPVIGYEGKPTSAGASKATLVVLKGIVDKLGPYPHSKLKPGARQKTQGTRLLKFTCPDCGLIARMTEKWADVGLKCGDDNIALQREEA